MVLPGKWEAIDFLTIFFRAQGKSLLLKQLVEENGSLQILNENLHKYKKFPVQSSLFLENESRSRAEDQVKRCKRHAVNIVTIWDDKYPPLLRHIDYPPVALFVKGDVDLTKRTSISIVGTRQNTLYGKHVAEKFVETFVENDIVITSGLANGIDSIAHYFTVKAGGTTIAVIASGLDEMMTTSKKMTERIIEGGGAVYTEYPCGTIARPGHFPQRNRIISGVSVATLVVESDVRGGSLITARFAFEQNREVFAVPGPIFSAKSSGTNELIKKNAAQAATSPRGVLEDLRILQPKILTDLKQELKFDNKVAETIYALLSGGALRIDELADQSDINISELNSKLIEMELEGIIKQMPGKFYIRNT